MSYSKSIGSDLKYDILLDIYIYNYKKLILNK